MIIIEFLQALTLVLGCIVFVLCLIMVSSKATFKKLSQLSNRSFSTRKMLKPFEIPRHFDIFSIFQARTVFILVLICSGLSLFFIFSRFDAGKVAQLFSKDDLNMTAVYQVLFQIIYWGLLISLSLCSLVSLIALLKPESFLSLNQKTACWISTRKGYKSLDMPRNIDEVLFNYHKQIGLLGIAASLGMIFSVLVLI